MRSMVFLLSLGLLLSLLSGCTSSPVRLPNASEPANQFNQNHVRYLRQAADAGILFLISENALQDRPVRQVGTCKKLEDPIWDENLYAILEKLEQNPKLYGKFHVLRIRRGNTSQVNIEKDSDGLAYLNVEYTKRRSSEKITAMTDVPCGASTAEYVGREIETTSFEWPSVENVVSLLNGLEEKAALSKMNFDRRILVYLADRLILFKAQQDHFFEKAPNGDDMLPVVLNKLSAEVAGGGYAEVDFWIKEISVNSVQAANIGFFGLRKDMLGGYGIRVDSVGKYARKINGFADSTYLYTSFKPDGNSFAIPSLSELNSCLTNLTRLYRSPDFRKAFDIDRESYLFPGYPCKSSAP